MKNLKNKIVVPFCVLSDLNSPRKLYRTHCKNMAFHLQKKN